MSFIVEKEVEVELPNFYGKVGKVVTIKHATTGSRYLDELFNLDGYRTSFQVEHKGSKLKLSKDTFSIERDERMIYYNTDYDIGIKDLKAIVKNIENIDDICLGEKLTVSECKINYLYPNFTVRIHNTYRVTSTYRLEGLLDRESVINKITEIGDRLISVSVEIDGSSSALVYVVQLINRFSNNKHEYIRFYNNEFDITVTDNIIDTNTATLKFIIRILFRYALTGILPNVFPKTQTKNANF